MQKLTIKYFQAKFISTLKESFTMIQWDLSLEWLNICKSISVIHHIKKMKQNNHNHLNCYRKCIWQNSASIHSKNSYQLGREGTYLKKIYMTSPELILYSMMKGWKLHLYHQEQDNGAHPSTPIQHGTYIKQPSK